MTEVGVTGQQMCEAISRYLKAKHNIDMSPERIWNSSPSGELFHVFAYYEAAKAAGYEVDRK